MFVKTQKQIEATLLHASGATFVMLYGGARSGKTFITLRNVILRALMCESRHAVLRFRFSHVKTSVILDTFPKVMKLAFQKIKYSLNKQDYFVKFGNGSEIWFAGLDDKQRTEKILGNEYSTVYLNECSQLSFQAVEMAMTRLAQKTKLKNKMFFDCNPRSKSDWTYKLFIEKKNPRDNSVLSNPEEYKYLLMNPCDNLPNISEGYQNILASMSMRERNRFEFGQFSDDTEGALWNLDLIVTAQSRQRVENCSVTVVAVDPAVTDNENSDLTGIVVLESNGKEANVLFDYSLKTSPDNWAQIVINAYNVHNANYIVVETNQGGDLVESILKSKNANIHIKKVRASKGKFARAEPVLALYEQGKIHHAKNLSKLEEEMMGYVPYLTSKSPDRLDALVWGLSDVILNNCNFESTLLTW